MGVAAGIPHWLLTSLLNPSVSLSLNWDHSRPYLRVFVKTY